MQEKEIDEEEKLIIFNKAYSELRNFIIKSVINYDKIKEKENEEGLNLGDLAKLDYTKLLPYEMNLRTIKIGKRETKYIIYIKAYPLYFEELIFSKKMNVISSLNKLIMKIFNKDEYHFIKIEFPEISISDGKNNDNVEKERLNKINNSNESFFELNKHSIFPNELSFLPDSNFLDFCKKNLHSNFYNAFLKYYEFNCRIENLSLKNGVIDFYNDNNLNISLMYLINKVCHKKYSVKNFEMDKVLKKLILIGVDDVNKLNDDNNDIEPITNIFKEKMLLDFLKSNKLTNDIDVVNFIENIINNISFLNYYNHSTSYEDMKFDKNVKEVLKSFNASLMNLRLSNSELFYIDSVKKSLELVNIITILISKYFNIYNEKNITKELFLIVKAEGQDIKKDVLKSKK